MKSKLWIIIFGIMVIQTIHTNKDVYFIADWYGGFFASLNCVLNHLWWCDQNNKIPIVYWDHRSPYYKPGGFNGRSNVWEYYFEPVSHLNYKPSNPIFRKWSPFQNFLFCGDYSTQKTRESAYQVISKFIKIQPIVQRKIDNFYQKNMQNKYTVGIHLRGTDKWREAKLVSPEKIISIALQYADKDTQFLLASDEQVLMNRMINLLKGHKVIYYNCYRSNSSNPLWVKQQKPPIAQLGEDVLVEVQLLSKCDLLIHTISNVSTGALYFNPTLEHILVTQKQFNFNAAN